MAGNSGEENNGSLFEDPEGLLFRILFALIQLTWGMPQTLAGLYLFLKYRKKKHRRFHLAVLTEWDKAEYGLSLGPFLFAGEGSSDHFAAHEYGHSIQSLLLGPFYLFLIGLPSIYWCRSARCVKRRQNRGNDYYSFYTEAWAEHIAERYRGESI